MSLRTLLLTIFALATGPVLADEQLELGKKVFLEQAQPSCTVCHTLNDAGSAGEIGPNLDQLKSLARRLPQVWNAPTTDTKLKQRIAQILIKEVVLDVDEDRRESVALVHWKGGRHSEVRVHRNRRGFEKMRLPRFPGKQPACRFD